MADQDDTPAPDENSEKPEITSLEHKPTDNSFEDLLSELPDIEDYDVPADEKVASRNHDEVSVNNAKVKKRPSKSKNAHSKRWPMLLALLAVLILGAWMITKGEPSDVDQKSQDEPIEVSEVNLVTMSPVQLGSIIYSYAPDSNSAGAAYARAAIGGDRVELAKYPTSSSTYRSSSSKVSVSKNIVFSLDDRIFFGQTLESVKQILEFNEVDDALIVHAVLSPDETKIAFGVLPENVDDIAVYMVNVDGSNLTKVYEDTEFGTRGVDSWLSNNVLILNRLTPGTDEPSPPPILLNIDTGETTAPFGPKAYTDSTHETDYLFLNSNEALIIERSLTNTGEGAGFSYKDGATLYRLDVQTKEKTIVAKLDGGVINSLQPILNSPGKLAVNIDHTVTQIDLENGKTIALYRSPALVDVLSVVTDSELIYGSATDENGGYLFRRVDIAKTEGSQILTVPPNSAFNIFGIQVK